LRRRAVFWYFLGVSKVEINPRGNGACPLCKNNEDCRLKSAALKSLSPYKGLEMELVVYQCSQFAEKA